MSKDQPPTERNTFPSLTSLDSTVPRLFNSRGQLSLIFTSIKICQLFLVIKRMCFPKSAIHCPAEAGGLVNQAMLSIEIETGLALPAITVIDRRHFGISMIFALHFLVYAVP
jgi:hypothetical protein